MSAQNDWNLLLWKAQKGDLEAQNLLCEKLKVRLHPVLKCRLQGWSAEDRQDIMQDTLIIFLEKMGSIDSNPHMYTFKILKNKIGNALQSRQKAIEISLQTDGDKNPEKEKAAGRILSTGETEDDVLDKLDRKIAIENILRAIVGLSDFCRIFIMGMIEGKSIEELWKLFQATEPGLQRNTFDKRTFDCRKRVRKLAYHKIDNR